MKKTESVCEREREEEREWVTNIKNYWIAMKCIISLNCFIILSKNKTSSEQNAMFLLHMRMMNIYKMESQERQSQFHVHLN